MDSFELYKSTVAQKVGIINDFSLRDVVRDRRIFLKIYYPEATGLFPVIFFSHGSGGSQNSFSHLGYFWASHGYISIHPTHQDNSFSSEEDMALNRTLDISFLMDTLRRLQRRIPIFGEILDDSRIGIGGHSMGAYTAMLMAGTVVDFLPKIKLKSDRLQAFLCISPQGTGERGLNQDSWKEITTPIMTISGTKETYKKDRRSWRLEPFQYLPKGNKTHILIREARHYSYNDSKLAIADPLTAKIHSYLQCASLAFWDSYLKQESAAQAYLQSNALSSYSNGNVSIFRK